MKKILKNISFLLLAVTLVVSCDDTGDDNTEGLTSGGVIVSLDGSGKMLGTPLNSADLENSVVNLTDATTELNLHIYNTADQVVANVAKFQLTKSFNGENKHIVSESVTLPFDFSYATIAEFLDGTGVASVDDLRIGDQFTFQVENVMNDGSIYSGSSGEYVVTVNCLSDLAGAYSLRMISSNGYDVTFPNEMITEVSPGVYNTSSTYAWALNTYSATQGFEFNDQCTILSVPEQGLFLGMYGGNPVQGTAPGLVDPATGDLTIYYSVGFSSGSVDCIGQYTKL
jgi:hypothetical protein